MTRLYDLPHREENKEDEMERFWIIFVEHTDGGRHYRHPLLRDAEKEAERLARLNPGKGVYLFECIGMCKVGESPVKWDIVKY